MGARPILSLFWPPLASLVEGPERAPSTTQQSENSYDANCTIVTLRPRDQQGCPLASQVAIRRRYPPQMGKAPCIAKGEASATGEVRSHAEGGGRAAACGCRQRDTDHGGEAEKGEEGD